MKAIHIQSQRGLTLIELLVGITLGIFIIGAALFVFQGVGSVGRQVNEMTQLRQQGATAFRLIGKQVREAGDIQPKFNPDNFNYRFETNYTWGNLTAAVGGWASPPTGVTQYLNLAQQVPSTATNPYLRDCLGNQITSTNQRSTFYIRDGRLMCATDEVPNGQPIISNVNEMVVIYRVRNGSNQRRFYSANETFEWKEVDAIEICLHMTGNRNTPTNGEEYENCHGELQSRDNKTHFIQKALFNINPAGLP